MPKKFEDCLNEVKKSLRKQHPDWSDEKISDVAYGTCVETTGLSPNEDERMSKNDKITWSSSVSVHESYETALSTLKRPNVRSIYGLKESNIDMLNENIDGSVSDDTHFYIVGEAIHPVTTLNYNTYLAQELEVAAETLTKCPVMVDHGKSSHDVVGKVLVSAWESNTSIDGAVSYIARVRKSHPVAEAIQVGDIDTVSIGAIADMVECSVCGEDMIYCPHRPGLRYERDGEEEIIAKAIGRGLTFRELSITPFPADTRASARLSASSLDSALTILVESSEFKQPLQKAGDKQTMSEDKNEELALAEEVRSRDAKIEQLRIEKEKADKELAEFQEREKADLVGRAFELEVKANISKSEDEKVRKTELNVMSVDVLRSKIEDAKRFVTQMEKLEPPKSQAVVVGTEEEENHDPLVYSRNAVKAGLREALGGMRTSEYARKTVIRDSLSQYNPNNSEYKRLLKENVIKLRRNE